MKLKHLLKKVPLDLYRGNKEIEITDLSENSKLIAPGNLFVAKKGYAGNAARYIDEAIASGALAILADTPNPFLNIAQLVHPNVAAIEGELAANFYEHPSSELLMIGVTGTSGKTTTSYLIHHLLESLKKPAGLIGTVEYILGKFRLPATLTTTDVIANHKMLREMRRQDLKAAVMEVSSIGLHQGRCDQIDFDVALFTNFSRDHLDYHHTMEEYADAKALFFKGLKADKVAVINADSPWTKRIVGDCKARMLTFGCTQRADLYADEITLHSSGTQFQCEYQGKKAHFSTSLIGRFNIYNCLGAIGALLSQNVDFFSLPPLIATFTGVPGRLERVGNYPIFVDYAHKPDALENVLMCLKEFKQGKLIVVFGCGGDRDKGKRPLMAAIAEKYADFVIITSDNPRSENPAQICKEIASGFSSKQYAIEMDRREAIKRAIERMQTQDLILIAGKGHETYQIFAHQTISFDDRKVALELMKNL